MWKREKKKAEDEGKEEEERGRRGMRGSGRRRTNKRHSMKSK